MRIRASIPANLCVALSLIAACGDKKKDEKEPAPASENLSQNKKIYAQNVRADRPLLLVYGDSIATGVLSNTSLGQDPGPELSLQLGGYIKAGTYSPESFQAGVSNPDLAAATSSKDYGVREQIAKKEGLPATEVGLISLARFGARASDIPEMLSDWLEFKAEGGQTVREPNYILVALGSNDFCSDQSLELIQESFKSQIEAIHQSAPDATLIVAPAPPVPQLASIDFTYDFKLGAITGQEISCRKFREQYCKNIYAPDAAARWTAINDGMAAVVEQQRAQGSQVLWGGAIKDWKIAPEELSFDCFHPSAKGQETLGRLLQPAFESPAS